MSDDSFLQEEATLEEPVEEYVPPPPPPLPKKQQRVIKASELETWSRSLSNTSKEEIVLEFVDQFNEQYTQLFPTRPQLILCPKNECNVPKFVCTSVRPQEINYVELYDVDTCAKFVSHYVTYESLEIPDSLPEWVVSPFWTLEEQSGDCFDMGILLTSLLIGVGYDAYCVSGYAHKYVTTNDQTHRAWPDSVDKTIQKKEVKESRPSRYQIKRKAPLESEFEKKVALKASGQDGDASAGSSGANGPDWKALAASDGMIGQRRHCWVLVLAGKREVKEHFFLEPSTGEIVKLNDPLYLRIDSVWNDRNYWVNMQDPAARIKDLSFDLADLMHWECIFIDDQDTNTTDDYSYTTTADRAKAGASATVDAGEKDDQVLEIPPSWVPRLAIPIQKFQDRYPGQYKNVVYKDSVVEMFSPYNQPDGVVKRITFYTDDEHLEVREIHNLFEHRKDKLRRRSIYPLESKVHEWFEPGRRRDTFMESLKELVVVENERREMHFYSEARDDGLISRVELLDERAPHLFRKVMETYDRDDHLTYRSITFDLDGSTGARPTTVVADQRAVRKMTEKFSRNETKDAHEDVAKRVFSFVDDCIRLDFHFAPNHITKQSRVHPKTPGKHREGEGTHTPVPNVKRPKDSELAQEFESLRLAEKLCMDAIRESDREAKTILRTREAEEESVKFDVSTYDVVRNKPTAEALRELKAKQDAANESRLSRDYLTPFLPSDFGTREITREEAMEIRSKCLGALKDRIMQRAHIMQERLNEEKIALQRKNQAYMKMQEVMDKAQEDLHLSEVEQMVFRLEILEKRLARHEDESKKRYAELDKKLRMDPRLARFFV